MALTSEVTSAVTMPTHARFPEVDLKAGHYESFYLKACHPSEPLGVWIRYTVHKRPGGAPARLPVVHTVRRQRRRSAGIEGHARP